MITDKQDAFGHEVYDHLTTGYSFEVILRDDGYVNCTPNADKIYFTEYKDWWDIEKRAISFARGRVLDIGCGAGRHALYLQSIGHKVVAIDNSPLAVEVCKRRGVIDARLISLTQVNKSIGVIDTILMLGNNFALVGTEKRARWLLKKYYYMTSFQGRILAGIADPYKTTNSDHLNYHEFNRRRGKRPGELRIRVLYKTYKSPWIDFLFLSIPELKELVDGTGWQVGEVLESTGGPYVAILEKQQK